MYQYQPLDESRQEIRLLRLLPALVNDTDKLAPISCELTTFAADEAPSYVALSYTWGRPAPTKEINIDGQSYTIRTNLFGFLNAFRNDTRNHPEPLYLWIDQLCINQSDFWEKSSQVRHMPEIYSKSHYAIIWLNGPGLKVYAECYNNAELDSTKRRTYAKNILAHAYFSRLWVVQEFVLAPQREILCDGCWISSEELAQSHRALSAQTLGSRLTDTIVAPHSGLPTNGMHLHDCLNKFAHLGCEHSYDNVFALLGLVNRDERPTVDYQQSPSQLLVDVIRIIFRVRWNLPGRGVDVLHIFQHLGQLIGVPDRSGSLTHFLYNIRAIQDFEARQSDTDIGMTMPIEEIGTGWIADISNTSYADAWWYKYNGEVQIFFCDGRIPPVFSPTLDIYRHAFLRERA